jgi:hypothetical protein
MCVRSPNSRRNEVAVECHRAHSHATMNSGVAPEQRCIDIQERPDLESGLLYCRPTLSILSLIVHTHDLKS